MSPAEMNESRRSYHRHDGACGCAQAELSGRQSTGRQLSSLSDGNGEDNSGDFFYSQGLQGSGQRDPPESRYHRQIDVLKPGCGTRRNSYSWSLPEFSGCCNSNRVWVGGQS